MTSTPSADVLRAVRDDLYRAAVAMAAANDYREWGLQRESVAAIDRARRLVDAVAEVFEHWTDQPVEVAAAEAVVPVAALEAWRAAPREHAGTEQVGEFEVRTIGKKRFVRCPDLTCSRRVVLTDETSVAEIVDALHSHGLSGDCLARDHAKPAAKTARRG